MDDSKEDQRLPHHKEPKEFVSLDQLAGKVLVACVSYIYTLLVACVSYIYMLIVGFVFTSHVWTLTHVKIAELGVLSWKLDADNPETDPELKKIREERGYSYMVSDERKVCV